MSAGRFIAGIGGAGVLLLPACATVHVEIPLPAHAPIDVPTGARLEVTPLLGDDGTCAGALRDAFSRRANAAPPAERAAVIEVAGSTRADFHQELKSFDLKQSDLSGGLTILHFYTRHGALREHAALQVLDEATGKVLGSRTFTITREAVTRAAPDLMPAPIDAAALERGACGDMAEQLIGALTAHRKLFDAELYRGTSLPELDRIVPLARAGQLAEAIALATEAIAHATRGGQDASLAGMAFWDRGVLREALGQYEGARDDVQSAIAKLNDPDLADELDRIARLRWAAGSAR